MTRRRGSNSHGTSKSVVKTKTQALSARDDAILRAVYSYQWLSAEQVCRLFFSPNSLVFARAKLRALTQSGFLQRLQMPTINAGRTPYFYTLARKGISYLSAAGFSEFLRFRPSEQAEHSFLFLSHTLILNDVLIAADLLSRQVEKVALAEMQHERILKRHPVFVETYRNERVGVIPDAYLDMHIGGRARMSIVLELDRGTVEQKQFLRKLRGLLAYTAGPYQEYFGTDSVNVAFLTTAGQHRAELMRRWCEKILAEVGQQAEAEAFLFTHLPEGNSPPNPKALFLAPIWRQPFSPDPVALLVV